MDKILTFTNRQAFREWLGMFGTESDGIWLLFSKKEKSDTLSAGDALEEALCHGWIDGQIQSIDDNTYKKYFARRIPKSKWSVKNKELAQTLMEKGLMTQQGFEAIERARKSPRKISMAPSIRFVPPVLAPKKYWPAKPPAP